MIISRTPYRISFFGGGTDYPAWYLRHGGAVLAASIDKYCYITCRYLPPFFEHKSRIVYSKIESCQAVDEIDPALSPAARALRACGRSWVPLAGHPCDACVAPLSAFHPWPGVMHSLVLVIGRRAIQVWQHSTDNVSERQRDGLVSGA